MPHKPGKGKGEVLWDELFAKSSNKENRQHGAPFCTDDCFGDDKENKEDDFDSQAASRRGKGRKAKCAKPKVYVEPEPKPIKEKPVKKPPTSKRKGATQKVPADIEADFRKKFDEFDSIEKIELEVECLSLASQELVGKKQNNSCATAMQKPASPDNSCADANSSPPPYTPALHSVGVRAGVKPCDKTPDNCAITMSDELHTRRLKSAVRKCHVNGRRVVVQHQASSPALPLFTGVAQHLTAAAAANDSPVLQHCRLSFHATAHVTPGATTLTDLCTPVVALTDTHHSPVSLTPACLTPLDESEFLIPASVQKPLFSNCGLSLCRRTRAPRRLQELTVEEKVYTNSDESCAQLAEDASRRSALELAPTLTDAIEDVAETDEVTECEKAEEQEEEDTNDDGAGSCSNVSDLEDDGAGCRDSRGDESDSGVCLSLHDHVSRSRQSCSHIAEGSSPVVSCSTSRNLDRGNDLHAAEVVMSGTDAQRDFDANMRVLAQLRAATNMLTRIRFPTSTLNGDSQPLAHAPGGQRSSLMSDSNTSHHSHSNNVTGVAARLGSTDLDATRSFTDTRNSSSGLPDACSSDLRYGVGSVSVMTNNSSSEPVIRSAALNDRDRSQRGFVEPPLHHTAPGRELLPGIGMLNSARDTLRFMRERGILPAASPRLGKSRGKLSISAFKKDNTCPATSGASLAVSATSNAKSKMMDEQLVEEEEEETAASPQRDRDRHTKSPTYVKVSLTPHRYTSRLLFEQRDTSGADGHQLCVDAASADDTGCVETADSLCPRDRLLSLCQQDKPHTFADILPPSVMRSCKKIGEGTYAEVFHIRRGRVDVALKIIPVEGQQKVNDEQQKTFEDMLPEVIVARTVSELRSGAQHRTDGYVHFRSIYLVQDCYPDELLAQWDKFADNVHSLNDRPDFFEKSQYFVVFETDDSGSDLESCKLSSLEQAVSVVRQVAYALAVAECSCAFEHRDLHWGNVLVKPCGSTVDVKGLLHSRPFALPSAGVRVAVIDFTLSRLSHTQDGITTEAFCDLSREDSLFEGSGDPQYDVYRQMKLLNGNDWSKYTARSNVLWLQYLVEKLLHCKKYTTQRANTALTNSLTHLTRQLDSCNSLAEAVDTCDLLSTCH